MTSLPTTMKAVVVKEPGPAETSIIVEGKYPMPSLNSGEVLVKNEYAGLNFIDTYHRSGLYKRNLPFILGGEGGGVVAQVSPEVESPKVGDRVVYMAPSSYAEYTAVPATKIIQVPDGVDLELAVTCMVQGLTSHYLVTSATANLIHEGEWCLVYGAGSGTGQWAAQIAKIRGYKVIATTSQGKEEGALATGCNELIVLDKPSDSSKKSHHGVYDHDKLVSKVMEITGGKGVKCVLDGIGKATVDISLDVLAVRGIFISYGNASGAVPPFPLLRLLGKSVFVTRPKLTDYISTREELMDRVKEVFDWLESGKLRVKIDTIFPLSEAKKGHSFIESGKSKGKILFKI